MGMLLSMVGLGAYSGEAVAAGAAFPAAATAQYVLAAGGPAASGASSWLGYAGLGLSALGGLFGAAGASQQYSAIASAAMYNAAVARNNAQIQEQNAQYAEKAGQAKETASRLRTAAIIGSERAGQGASGIDPNTGSAVDVQSSSAAMGQLDALTIRNNAAREAYGYRVAGYSFASQANLEEAQAASAERARPLAMFGSLLSGAGSVADKWFQYQRAGVFGGTTPNPNLQG